MTSGSGTTLVPTWVPRWRLAGARTHPLSGGEEGGGVGLSERVGSVVSVSVCTDERLDGLSGARKFAIAGQRGVDVWGQVRVLMSGQ